MNTEPLDLLEKEHTSAETLDQSSHTFARPLATPDAPLGDRLPAPACPAPPSLEDRAFGVVLVTAAWSIVGWILLHTTDLAGALGAQAPLIAAAVRTVGALVG